MRHALVCCASLLLLVLAAHAEDAKPEAEKQLSGMSIVGNDEAPKSLVIVPWKTAALRDTLDVSRLLGDGREPVDRDVFVRELEYYQIRAESSDPRAPGAE